LMSVAMLGDFQIACRQIFEEKVPFFAVQGKPFLRRGIGFISVDHKGNHPQGQFYPVCLEHPEHPGFQVKGTSA